MFAEYIISSFNVQTFLRVQLPSEPSCTMPAEGNYLKGMVDVGCDRSQLKHIWGAGSEPNQAVTIQMLHTQ